MNCYSRLVRYTLLLFDIGFYQEALADYLDSNICGLFTPFGIHRFVTLPFWLVEVLVTFQCFMDRILCQNSQRAYAAAYLNEIIIYNNDWQQHLQHLRAVLRPLELGWQQTQWIVQLGEWKCGFPLGHGQVHSHIEKMGMIAAWRRPKTKNWMRQVLVLAGYYTVVD